MEGIYRVLFCTRVRIIIYIAVHCYITHTRINQELGVILSVNLIERTNKMRPCSRIYYSSVS